MTSLLLFKGKNQFHAISFLKFIISSIVQLHIPYHVPSTIYSIIQIITKFSLQLSLQSIQIESRLATFDKKCILILPRYLNLQRKQYR